MDPFSLIYPGIITVVTSAIAAFISWKLALLQKQTSKDSADSTEEIEFQKRLLELIQNQEERIKYYETRYDELDKKGQQHKDLIDELKRANLSITFENQQQRRRLADQELEIQRLREEINLLKKGSIP